MPSAANITVKKNDGTTDIVWSLINPASGNGVPALWRSETVSGPLGVRPTLSFKARENGPKTAVRSEGQVVFPQVYTDTTTGLVKVANRALIKIEALTPYNMDTTQLNEAVAQALNLFSSALIKQSIQAGSAPT